MKNILSFLEELFEEYFGSVILLGIICFSTYAFYLTIKTEKKTPKVDCYETCYPYKALGYYEDKQQCFCDRTILLRSVK